jgi:hypothetical protein
MPVAFSIQPIIDAQTTALNTTINAARDNVKADNTTQITAQNTALTTAINAARDDVKADNATKITAQNTALTAAITAKSALKSLNILEFSIGLSSVSQDLTIPAINPAKTVLVLASENDRGNGDRSGGNYTEASYTLKVINATTVRLTIAKSSFYAGAIAVVQVVEYV